MCFFPLSNNNPKSEAFLKGVTEFKCGACPECLRERANAWALRAVYEAKAHAFNSMVTLTYDNYARDSAGRIIGELPPDRNLTVCKRDVQLFIKRLRKFFDKKGVKFKYIVTAEYGKHTHRAHYHAILFGVEFDDCVRYKRSKRGNYIYKSATLSRLWNHGICTVDSRNVTAGVAKYCTKYCAKDTRADETFMLFSQNIGIADLITDFNGLSYFVEGREYPIPRKVWEMEICARYASKPYVFSPRYVNRTELSIADGSFDRSVRLRRRYRFVRDNDPQYRSYLSYWSNLAEKRKMFEKPVTTRILELDEGKYHFYKGAALRALAIRQKNIPVIAPRSGCKSAYYRWYFEHFRCYPGDKIIRSKITCPFPSRPERASDTGRRIDWSKIKIFPLKIQETPFFFAKTA